MAEQASRPSSWIINATEPILLVECPRLLFPFARRLMAEITREGGFPPLLIDPIDFIGLYRAQKAQEQNQSPPATDESPA